MIKSLFNSLGDEKKKQITEALMKVFSEKDLLTVSVKDIVDKAGISRGSFYTYFDTPIDAYLSVLRSVLARVHQNVEGKDGFSFAKSFIENIDTNPDRDFLKNYYLINETILEVSGEGQRVVTGEENLRKWMISVSIHELIRKFFLNPGEKHAILDRLSSLEKWNEETK